MPLDDARTARLMRQHLESLQRAGLTHWPRPVVSISINPPIESVAAPLSEHRRDIVAARPSRSTDHVEHAPAEKPLFSNLAAAIPKAAPASGTKSTLTLEQRQQRLEELKCSVAACTRCPELARTRTQTVFGVGNPEASILFVGEAPGADEDRLGEPFVGRAGQLLNDIIRACRLKREEIYICNILRCRPPGNRNPTPEEAANCREFLMGQIETVDPDYIVCWGSVAARNLLDTPEPIGKLRGRFYLYGRARVLCTYHPSYLLRNPSSKKDVWEDMKFLFRDMGIDLTAK